MIDIAALIAVRGGSKRVKNKNIKPFANSNLLSIKLEQAQRLGLKTYVSSDCDDMLSIAEKYSAITLKRDPYFASDHVPMREVYQHLAEIVYHEHILYLHVTSPLLKDETLENAIDVYSHLSKKYDSLASVHEVKEYMWINGKPLNYDPTNHPRSQDLPNIYALNFAFNIIPRNLMIEKRNIVGNRFFPYLLDKIESIDVDTELDFAFAEFIYKQKRNEVKRKGG